MYTIISSANSESLTSSFPVCIPLIYSCYLIALEHWALHWLDMEILNSHVLYLILLDLLWVSVHLIWCWLSTCCILLLLYLDMFLVSLISPRPLLWTGANFFQKLLQHLTRLFYFLQFIYMVNDIGRFPYDEPSLDFWDEAKWITVEVLGYFLMCSW